MYYEFNIYRWTSTIHAVIVTLEGIVVVLAVTSTYPIKNYTTFVSFKNIIKFVTK